MRMLPEWLVQKGSLWITGDLSLNVSVGSLTVSAISAHNYVP